MAAIALAIAGLSFVSTAGAQAPQNVIQQQQLLQQQFPGTVYVPPFDGKPTTSLGLNGISYGQAKRMEKVVENDLSLSAQYNYNFSMNLLAADQAIKARAVPDGWYALTMVILRTPTDSQRNLSAQDLFVTSSDPMYVPVVNGNVPNTNLWLKFTELAPSAQLDSLYIELIPLKTDCDNGPCVKVNADGTPDTASSHLELLPGFRPLLLYIPQFVPFLPTAQLSPIAVKPSDNPFGGLTLQQFASQSRKLQDRRRMQEKKKAPTPAAFAASNRLNVISLNDPRLQASSQDYIRKGQTAQAMLSSLLNSTQTGPVALDESYRGLMYVLCDLLAQTNQEYQARHAQNSQYQMFSMGNGDFPIRDLVMRCGGQAESLLRLTRVIHVGQIDRSQPVDRIYNKQLNYTISATSAKNRSHSNDTFTGFSVQPLGLLFKLVDNFVPLSSTVGLSYTINASNSRSENEGATTSLTDAMDFDPLGLNIPTVNSRVCLQVNSMAAPGSPFVDSRKDAKNGLYICGDAMNHLDVQEVYAHAFSYNHNSSLVNAFDPQTQTVNRSVRGDMEVSAFFWAIRKSLNAEGETDLLPHQFSQTAQNYFAITPRSVPLTVISPMTFNKETEPSFASKLNGTYREHFIDEKDTPN